MTTPAVTDRAPLHESPSHPQEGGRPMTDMRLYLAGLAVLAVALLIALGTASHGTPGIAAIPLGIVGAGLAATATTRSTK